MSLQIFKTTFLRLGISRPNQLLTPPTPNLEKFQFPLNAVYHHINYDNVHVGPDLNEYILKNFKNPIQLDHVYKLSETANKNNPSFINSSWEVILTDYHNRNKRFKRVREHYLKTKDKSTLLILNYNLLNRTSRYSKNFLTDYSKWYNIQSTIWDKVKEISEISDRDQFIFYNNPETLVSLQTLNNNLNPKIDQVYLNKFNNNELLFLGELWRWLSKDYAGDTVFDKIDIKNLNKINLIIEDSGRIILLNLGVLWSWRIDEYNPDKTQKIKIRPEQLQKYILGCLFYLSQSKIHKKEEESKEIENRLDHTGEITEVNEKDDIIYNEDDETAKEKAKKTLDELDKNLEILEQNEKLKEERKTNSTREQKYDDKKTIKEQIYTKVNTETLLKEKCDSLVELGVLSAIDYRKLTKSIENSMNIKSPYDENITITEFGKIDSSMTKVEEKQIPDIKTVIDKTMLKSTLLDFDSKYIKEVYKKDIVNSVTTLQRSGFIINKYEVEPVEDILGAYEIHSVRITPIEGEPSTLRFRIPILEEDGTYVSNGIKYQMRKQRKDAPIRKVSSERVALTSYYGKSFIDRSIKKSNDYGLWIREQIIARGLEEGSDIENIIPVDVFDNEAKTPRIYSIFSMGIKSFKYKDIVFSFEYNERTNLFKEETIKKFENNERTLVGLDKDNTPIIIDDDNMLYKIVNDDFVPIERLETFLGIDLDNSPIDSCTIKILGKDVPVGIVLAYIYGLDTLLKLLKATFKQYSAGTRIKITENQYVLHFSDEFLVLEKEDKLATLILSGFLDFSKTIRKFSLYSFDKKNVYLNVLESDGLSARYLKEIEAMDKCFIDSITEELLIEMKEPITFRGLLIRSAELLLTDDHPHLLDMRYMRLCGNERIAGAVYSEIVNAIREHDSKLGKSTKPIELNPFAVWKNITTDPSKILINDINPIENLKQQESVTFGGVGGRTARTLSRPTREFHKRDTGIISESTTDSSDVGVNTFTTANPSFTSVRGLTKDYNLKEKGATGLLSTSSVLSVGTDQDD